MNVKRRIVSICMCMMMVFAMAPLVPYGGGMAFAADIPIPPADVTYTQDNDWEGTLLIDEDKTVKISNVTHDNTGKDAGAAIKIADGATVNLVFEGSNVLSGNPNWIVYHDFFREDIPNAGIEVEDGSTVNIYGEKGAMLNVTGGHYSAGIGGVGCDAPDENNSPAGNINIYSGTITAIGGDHGAGIGSGYHSSASHINICGGDITALGTSSGAGIGSGYGTAGGASNAARVGFYKGGDIMISGGTVFAAAYHIDRNDLDIFDTGTLYTDNYENTFAAGIGGGYGASSGDIVIEGDAEVTAIGAAGGAGIGTGRGTTNEHNYNEEKFDCSVTIRGSARVNALAADRINNSDTSGGAAIGLGRGCTIVDAPKGSVEIGGNAEVYAVGPYQAAAIGGSFCVGKAPYKNATLATLTIGSGATVTAVSDGYRPAVDLEPADFVSLNADEAYFNSRDDFYTEDVFPVRIDTVKAGSTGAKTTFAMQIPQKLNAMVHVPKIGKYSFIIKDYRGGNGERLFLSNAVEQNSAQFQPGASYDLDSLTARLDRSASVSSKYGSVGVKIQAAEGIFEYGSSFFAEPAGAGASAKLDKKYKDKLGKILYIDAGVKDRAGETCAAYQGGKPVISIQLPSGWNKSRTQALLVKNGADQSFAGSQKFTASGGKTYVSFGTVCGGTFALLEQKAPKPAPPKVSGTLLSRMTAKGKTSLVLSWSKVKGAAGYDIFFVRCRHDNAPVKVKTIKGNQTFQWTKKNLKKKRAYKAVVKAYVMKNGKKTYVRTSPVVHAYTSGGTKHYTNAKSVIVKKASVSLKTGKTYKIKAGVTKLQKGKKLMPAGHAPKLRYISSNKKIATVSKYGKIKAKSKGSCKIYVIAVNGASKTVKVTVK